MLFDHWKEVSPILVGLPRTTIKEAEKDRKVALKTLRRTQKGRRLSSGIEMIKAHPNDPLTGQPFRNPDGSLRVVSEFVHFLIYDDEALKQAAQKAGEHARALGVNEAEIHNIHMRNMRLGHA